jgi:hypothetical protein
LGRTASFDAASTENMTDFDEFGRSVIRCDRFPPTAVVAPEVVISAKAGMANGDTRPLALFPPDFVAKAAPHL